MPTLPASAALQALAASLLVLSAVIMSTIGVFLGLMIMGQPFTMVMTGIGIIALAGVVVNNNIVLIDTYQEYSVYMPRIEAITRTAEDRIRPVLLTTLTGYLLRRRLAHRAEYRLMLIKRRMPFLLDLVTLLMERGALTPAVGANALTRGGALLSAAICVVSRAATCAVVRPAACRVGWLAWPWDRRNSAWMRRCSSSG